MFGWVDFREDEKKRVENRRENEWEECLVERGRGREKWWDPIVFSLGPPQFNLSKMERKWGRKGGRVSWTKLPFSIQWPTFCVFLNLSFRCGFFFFPWIEFLLVCTVCSRWFGLVLVFFLDKILHSRRWFFLFVYIYIYILISF